MTENDSHISSNVRKGLKSPAVSSSYKRKPVTGETRRPNEPLPEIPLQDHESSAKSSLRMGRGSSQMSSNNYEVLHTTNSSSPTTIGGLGNQRYIE